MIEFDKVDTKEHLMKHTGVNSWFLVIKDVVDDFVSEYRIVWVDIEGVPLNAWSRETFVTIGKKWGETLDLEDTDISFGRKRVFIKTKHATSILESFKIIVKGKVYMVRAKELFTWNPVFLFLIHKERECTSDVESVHEPLNNNVNDEEYGDEYASDVNEVPIFGANSSSNTHSNGPRDEQQSEDPFGLYDLLNKKKAREISEPSPSLSHPPVIPQRYLGASQCKCYELEVPMEDHNEQVGQKGVNNEGSILGVMEDVIRVGQAMGYSIEGLPMEDHNEQVGQKGVNNEGSILGVMEDVIRVGQAMGYSIEGCMNDLVAIIGKQGEDNDNVQKSKVTWGIEGDENLKFFHEIMNKKRSQLAIRGIFIDGFWCIDPGMIKKAFFNHFEARFKEPGTHRFKINFQFPKKLVESQADELERVVSRDEIRLAVWNCGDNKSPGP
nr:RNA-directed DNA polymerase, eukaryota [Tanacetum cinerariifolium]